MPSTEGRFASHVDSSGDGCWMWTGAGAPQGYGRFRIGGRVRLAHRVAMEFALDRQLDSSEWVDHICHNISCVRPEHLRLATIPQNGQNRAGLPANNTAGYLGVTWHKRAKKWMAQVGHEGANHYLGLYATREEAGEAARQKRLELFTHNDRDRAEAS